MSEQSAAFESVEAVVDALREHGYIADIRLATIVFLVIRLDKPLLIEGPAGVGKTELAKALALISERRLMRLQCYEGQDESRALYEWDYGKQLLYTQMLRPTIGRWKGKPPRSNGRDRTCRRTAPLSTSASCSSGRCCGRCAAPPPRCC